jgi:hypothetical protein
MSLTKLSLGGKKLNYSRPERVWSVTSRLGTGKRPTLFYSVAAGRLGAPTTTAISHGRLQGEEASFPVEGKLEAEATPESEDAATFTGVVSLGEAGGGPGAAGRSFPPGSIRSHNPDPKNLEPAFFYSVIQIVVDVVLYIILNLVSEKT